MLYVGDGVAVHQLEAEQRLHLIDKRMTYRSLGPGGSQLKPNISPGNAPASLLEPAAVILIMLRSSSSSRVFPLATWSLNDRTLRPHPGRKEYVSSSLLRKGSWIAVQSVPEFGVPSRTSPKGPSKCRVSVQNLATATVASTTSWPEDVLDWPVVGLRHTPWVQTILRKMQCPPKPSSVLRGRIQVHRECSRRLKLPLTPVRAVGLKGGIGMHSLACKAQIHQPDDVALEVGIHAHICVGVLPQMVHGAQACHHTWESVRRAGPRRLQQLPPAAVRRTHTQ